MTMAIDWSKGIDDAFIERLAELEKAEDSLAVLNEQYSDICNELQECRNELRQIRNFMKQRGVKLPAAIANNDLPF